MLRCKLMPEKSWAYAKSMQALQSRAVVSLKTGVLPPIVSQMTPWPLFEEEGMTDPLFLKGCVPFFPLALLLSTGPHPNPHDKVLQAHSLMTETPRV